MTATTTGFLAASLSGAGRAPKPGENASEIDRCTLIAALYENLLLEDAQHLVDQLRPAWERAREYHRLAAEGRRLDEDLLRAQRAYVNKHGSIPYSFVDDEGIRTAESAYWKTKVLAESASARGTSVAQLDFLQRKCELRQLQLAWLARQG